MGNIIKDSFIYKIILCISNFAGNLFKKSFLVNKFIGENNSTDIQNSSIILKVFNKIINILRNIATKLKLDKLFENSIFTKPIIWLTITVAAIPFVPTMLCLAMILFTFCTVLFRTVLDKNYELKYFKINAWILIFIITIAVSTFTSVSQIGAMNVGLITIAFVMSFFVAINAIRTKKDLKAVLYAFSFSAIISAFYGIYQYFFTDIYSQAWLDDEMFEDIRMRVYSTFENPNVYGEYLILAVSILVGMFFEEKGIIKKVVTFAAIGLTTVALILTFSRGCWLGLLLALAIFLIIKDRRFIWLGLVALMLMPLVLPTSIINRFTSIGDLKDSSTSYRVNIWMGSIAMLKDYWITGIGVGEDSFNTIYPLYSYSNISAPHSHNLYLQLLICYGIIGFIVFVGVIYNFFKQTTISIIKHKNAITGAIMAGVAGFLLQSMFDYTWYNYRVMLIFWIVLGIGIASSSIKEDSKEVISK